MKNRLLVCLLLVASFACRNESNTAPGAEGNTKALQKVLPAPKPIPDTREAQLLLRDYWVFEFFIVPGNREQTQFNRGKWYQFKGDGTFTAGHWQDYTTKGVWTLFYGNDYPVIHLIAENDELTGEYQIQGVSGDTEYMSWVGTDRYGQKGFAAKVMNLLSTPTRQQFGVEQ